MYTRDTVSRGGEGVSIHRTGAERKQGGFNMSKRKKKGVSTKVFLSLLALVLVVGCAVGGTIAWLTAKTDPVVNTFTYGKININLGESTGNAYTIIPGVNISKDPKVTVKAGSEACWLFVKVAEANWPTFTDKDGRKVSYTIATGWEELPGESGVYYREVNAVTADTDFYVLKDNQVHVSETLTKAEVNSVTAENQPKLIFTAYAVQKDGIDTAAEAWAQVSN